MEVQLLDYTKNAEDILIFTKHTRRLDGKSSLEEISKMPKEEKEKELEYIFKTISGPWEFIDYTFMIKDVTRAFTHQLVRQRVGTSFAQESLRIVDKKDFKFLNTIDDAEFPLGHKEYETMMGEISDSYSRMTDLSNAPIQDVRGILPTNILTNIVMKINLRALNSMMNTRLCIRTQGEYQDVAKEMRELVLEVHSWAEPALRVFCMEWGVCKFPAFKDCPLKQEYPWLNRPDDNIDSARGDWEEMIGMKVQPKK